jgi:hypothetical protein
MTRAPGRTRGSESTPAPADMTPARAAALKKWAAADDALGIWLKPAADTTPATRAAARVWSVERSEGTPRLPVAYVSDQLSPMDAVASDTVERAEAIVTEAARAVFGGDALLRVISREGELEDIAPIYVTAVIASSAGGDLDALLDREDAFYGAIVAAMPAEMPAQVQVLLEYEEADGV